MKWLDFNRQTIKYIIIDYVYKENFLSVQILKF